MKPAESDDTETKRERLYAPRVPAEALTLEEWEALGYGADGDRTRPFTDDPIGTHRHQSPEAPTT